MNVDILVGRFRNHYGHTDFTDGKYIEEEHAYKFERGQQMREWLDRDALRQLIEAENWPEVAQRVVQSFSMTSGPLARWDEYQWVRGLGPEEQQRFALALDQFLYGQNGFPERLELFVSQATEAYLLTRERDPAYRQRYRSQKLSWPFVSYFHFLMWPDQEYVFVKPTPLRGASRASGFDIDYDSKPNRVTYASVQEFYRALWPTVQSLGGRDWIDVQGLIHVTGGGFDESPGGDAGDDAADVPVDQIGSGDLLQPPHLAAVLDYVDDSAFTFSPDIVTNYHLSLLTKPFVILTGLSGTGKTKLTRLYADAVHGVTEGVNNPYYQIVAVHPDWTDSQGLLGYYNPISRTYQATTFLRFMLRASVDPTHWYYICLDEMNLARVEYYFSDFLSALESGEAVALHTNTGHCVATEAGEGIQTGLPDDEAEAQEYLVDGVLYVPSTLPIPPNLAISGTVNVDETTHAFSDKVLDRANSIEFNRVDLEEYFRRYRIRYPDRENLVSEVVPLLGQVHAILEPRYLHFGYRTLDEVLAYLWHNETLSEEVRQPREVALDDQIVQKILPKLRGDERIQKILERLDELLPERLGEDSRSVDKLRWMLEELQAFGSTHFWR